MKLSTKITIGLVFILCASCIFFGGDNEEITTNSYDPVIMNRSNLDSSIELLGIQEEENTGKIYIKDNFIFINDKFKGFHIIDNSNPTQPQKVNFLQVLGSTDLSIKNNVFYINQGSDLLALTMENNSVTLVKRLINALTPISSPNGNYAFVEDNEIVVNWIISNN